MQDPAPSSPTATKAKPKSSTPSPFEDVAWLSTSLIRSPRSLQDHVSNLALFAAHPSLALELGYRTIFPNLTHADLVQMLEEPSFREKMDRQVTAQLLLQWPALVMRQAQRAHTGDPAAFRVVAERLGYAVKSDPAQIAMEDVMSKLQAVWQNSSKPIDVKAEVK